MTCRVNTPLPEIAPRLQAEDRPPLCRRNDPR